MNMETGRPETKMAQNPNDFNVRDPGYIGPHLIIHLIV
jgi:hypothetical protein